MKNKRALSLVLFAMLCLIWGSTWLAIKIGLEELPPFKFAGVRFLIASALLFLLVRIKGLSFPRGRSEWLTMLILSIFMIGLPYGLVFWGEQYIPAGLAAVLNSTIPLFVALFAHLTLPGERLSLITLLGLILGFGSVVVIFSDKLAPVAENALWGELALLGSAVSYGFATVFARSKTLSHNPIVTVTVQMFCGAIMLLAAGFIVERQAQFTISPCSVGALLYLAIVGSALAFVAYFWLIKQMEATRISLVAFVTPVIALLLGWILLDELITPRILIGAGLVIIGIITVNVKRGRGERAGSSPV